jgi:hypothetical protein
MSINDPSQILEKSAFLREAGAAIHLPPNCTALLRWMDIDPTDFGGTLLNEVSFEHPHVADSRSLMCLFEDASVRIRR